MAGPWTWDPKSRRYRNSATGTYLSHAEAISLRDQFLEHQKQKATELTRDLFHTAVDVDETKWERGMRRLIKDTYVDMYALARGGHHLLTQADQDRIGMMLTKQYEFFERFAIQVHRQALSPAKVAARARMYPASAVQAFEMGNAQVYGLDLPAYPGDGTSICLSHCRCFWEIEETPSTWECTWQRTANESCETCVDRGEKWAPYVIRKDGSPVLGDDEYKQLRDQIITEWVAGSRRKFPVNIKAAARAEFGSSCAVYNPKQHEIEPKLVQQLRPVLRRMYEETQKDLKRRGISSFDLFRGVQKKTYRNVLESWSEEAAIAEGYGIVIPKKISAERILLWYGGPGWKGRHAASQLEFLILGEEPK